MPQLLSTFVRTASQCLLSLEYVQFLGSLARLREVVSRAIRDSERPSYGALTSHQVMLLLSYRSKCGAYCSGRAHRIQKENSVRKRSYLDASLPL